MAKLLYLQYSMTCLSPEIRSQSQEIVKFVIFGLLIFLNCEGTCDLTDVPASMCDRKPTPDVSKISTTFYDVSVSCNGFSKTEMRQIGASGTD